MTHVATMPSTSSHQAGARHRTEVDGVLLVVGQSRDVPGGRVRRDVLLAGETEIGALHLKVLKGRTELLSQCGDEFVLGHDVKWVAERSGRFPQSATAMQANESDGHAVASRAAAPGRRLRP